MKPLPIIQFNATGDPVVWEATTFKEALAGGDLSHTHGPHQLEGKFEQLLSNNLATLGVQELADKRFKYVALRQCTLPRQNSSSIYPDIIVVREDGKLFVIEVKLEHNSELFNRKAIGQVIEYASALSALSETELAGMLNQTDEDRSLGELFDVWFGPSSSYRIRNRTAFTDNIAVGKLNLIIVSDVLPSGVYDWIDGWSTQNYLPFNFSAIEVTPFINLQSKSVILIPQTKVETAIISRTVVEFKQQDGVIRPEITISSADDVEQSQRNARRRPKKLLFSEMMEDVSKRVESKVGTQVKCRISKRSDFQEQIVFCEHKYVSALRLYLNEDDQIIDWLIWMEFGTSHIDPDDKVPDAMRLVKVELDQYNVNFDTGSNVKYRGAGISCQHKRVSVSKPDMLGQLEQPAIEDTEELREELSTLYAAFIKAHLEVTSG